MNIESLSRQAFVAVMVEQGRIGRLLEEGVVVGGLLRGRHLSERGILVCQRVELLLR